MHDQLQTFLDEHGQYINFDDKFVFSDGAVVEAGMMGRMIPPPEDKWELAKLVAQYWLLVSQQDEQALVNFKSYLGGHGQREAAWATLFTEGEQLAHLESLQLQAKRSRARYMAAKRKAKAETPFWMEEGERAEVDEAQKMNAFKSKLEQFQL